MRALEDSVYRIGDAQVHVAARSVHLNGESHRLRPKNFELLVFLIQRRGQIVTKGELLREVWPDVAVTENSLVKCVRELRKALGDDLRNPRHLQSVPKVGYQLVGAVEEEPAVTSVEVQHTTTVELEYREEISTDSTWRMPLTWVAAAAGILLLFGAYHWWVGRPAVPRPAAWHWQEVAWWKLDEGRGAVVHDAAGHGLDGTLSSGVSWAGNDGLWFSGLDAAVTGHDRGVLPAGDHARTISAWIKTTVPQLDATAILAYGNYQRAENTSYFGFGLVYDGRVSFGVSSLRGSISGTRRLDDAWHMVTVTYDGPVSSVGKIFIDGIPDRDGVLAARPATTSGSAWKIGRYHAGYTDFRGNIKDVRVFDRALTEPQVAGLFACTSAAKDIGDYYYLPVMLAGLGRETRATGAASTPFRNDGREFQRHATGEIQSAMRHDERRRRRRRAEPQNLDGSADPFRRRRKHHAGRAVFPQPHRGLRRRTAGGNVRRLLGAIAFQWNGEGEAAESALGGGVYRAARHLRLDDFPRFDRGSARDGFTGMARRGTGAVRPGRKESGPRGHSAGMGNAGANRRQRGSRRRRFRSGGQSRQDRRAAGQKSDGGSAGLRLSDLCGSGGLVDGSFMQPSLVRNSRISCQQYVALASIHGVSVASAGLRCLLSGFRRFQPRSLDAPIDVRSGKGDLIKRSNVGEPGHLEVGHAQSEP